MSKTKEALQMAREEIAGLNGDPKYSERFNDLLETIDEALAEQGPFAYFYHDATSAEAADPMLHSTLLVLAKDRRPTYRNETPLYTHPEPANQRSVPDGYKLVPIKPTREMLDAASRAAMQHMIDCINDPKLAKQVGSEEMTRKTWASRYKAMLAAAPEAPAWQELSKAERKPLTDEQIDDLWSEHEKGGVFDVHDFARAIEAAHGIGDKA